MQFNLSNVNEAGNQSNEYKALPEDRYTLRVENAEFKMSRTNKPLIETTFVVADGKFAKRKIWNNYFLTEKAVPIFKKLLTTINSPLAEKAGVEGHDLAAAIQGATVSYMVTEGLSNSGKPRNEIDPWSLQAVDAVAPAASSPAPATGSGTPPNASKLFA